MIARHNSVVTSKNQITYFIGDFTFSSYAASKEILSRMNGQKILILGNHDISDKRHISVKQFLEMGFKDVITEKIIKFSNGEVALLKHYPYEKHPLKLWWMRLTGKLGPFKKYHAFYPINKGLWLLHGHVHRGPKRIEKQINVNVETWDYYPVSESQICKMMAEYKAELNSRPFKRLLKKIVNIITARSN